MKKIYRLGITMLLVLAAALPTAFAYNFVSDGIYYNITGVSPNTVAVTYATGSYNSYSGNVDIPSSVTYNGTTYTVTAIGNSAFRNCSGLTGVSIPGTVTSIGEYAFYECGYLPSITIPYGVETIGGHAFDNCWGLTTVVFNAVNCSPTSEYYSQYCDYYSSSSMMFCGCHNVSTLVIGNGVQSIPDYAFANFGSVDSITIPNSVTSIGKGSFRNCTSLVSVTMGNAVSTIGEYAFYGCLSLSSMHIPNSVVSIGTCALSKCTNLSSLTVANGNTVYDSRNNCNSVIHTASNTLVVGCKNSTLPNTITSIGDYAFYECNTFSGTLTLPNSVKQIGTRSFYGSTGLSSSLIIGDSISVVGYEAFCGCSGLTSLVIGKSVDSIGNNAFGSCGSLVSVSFNADSCSCLNNVFGYGTSHSITTLTIGNNVKIIPDGAFSGFNIGTLNIPNSIRYIGNNAFSGCSISGMLFLPNSVIYIGDKAFYECVSITGTLTIPNSVTYIGNDAFSSCYGITGTLTIPNSVTYIGNNAFSRCGISSVAIYADSCSSGYSPFQFCNDLETFTIGNTVRIIPNNVFEYCYHLTGELFIPNSVKRIGEKAFRNCTGFIGTLNLPNSLTYIGNNAFEGCTGFTGKLVIPDSVVTIGNDAFRYISGLDTLVVGKAVESIGYTAFDGCNISHISFMADSCVYMRFSGCNNLISLTIGDNVKNIPDHAFYGCNNLAGKLVIPDSVITIGKQAFYNCVGFDTLVVGESVKNIQYNSLNSNIFSPFSGCSGLNCLIYNAINCNSFLQNYYVFPSNISSLVIGEKVRRIPDYAFKNLNISGTLIIPDAVVSIGKQAFYGRQIDTLTIGKSVALIDQEAFASCPLNYLAYNADSCSFGINYNYLPFKNCNNLNSLVIGENVKVIPSYAFSDCTALTGTLFIPDSVSHIGHNSFIRCTGINKLILGKSVSDIGRYAFSECTGLSGMLTMPDEVKHIGAYSFNGCNGIDSLHIGKKMSAVDTAAFKDCSDLKFISYNADSCSFVYHSWNHPFYYCTNLNKVIFGNSVKSIPDGAFYQFYTKNQLSGNLIIPDSVTQIGKEAFSGCNQIASLSLGRSVALLDSAAFSGCVGIGTIYSYAKIPPSIVTGVNVYPFSDYYYTFNNVNRNIPVYVPCESVTAYQNAWPHKNYPIYFTNIQGTLIPYLLAVASADTTQGTTQVVTQPTCTGPAVIEAAPNFFYVFDHWSDGNTDNPRTITLTQDTTLVAHFRESTLTILPPSDTALGQILVLQEPTAENPQAIIQVIPSNCYAFNGWVSPANNWGTISYENPYTLTLYQDTVIRASFYYLGSHISISSSNNSICEGDTVLIIASGGESYLWAKTHWDDEQGIYINEDTIGFGESVALTESGSYRVRGTDSANCYMWSSPVSVVVNPNPIITLSGQTEMCQGDSTTIYVAVERYATSTLSELSEDFSNGIPNNWTVVNNKLQTKTLSNSDHGMAIKFPSYNLNPGEMDELLLPDLDFTRNHSSVLKFDVAYRRYSYAESEQLRVLCSADNGNSWNILYSKAGQTLATLSPNTSMFTPTDNQWRTDSIDLSAFSGVASVMIKFEFTSDYGNNLWIDNVQIYDAETNSESGLFNYVWSDQTVNSYHSFNSAGTWQVTVSDTNGCSTIDSVSIIVWQPSDTTQVTVTADQAPFIWNGEIFCASDDYTLTLQNIHGCDSVVSLHLTITPPDSTVVSDTVFGYYYGEFGEIMGVKYSYQYQITPEKYTQWADSVLATSDIPVNLSYDSITNMASKNYIDIYYYKFLPNGYGIWNSLYPDYTIWKDSAYYDVFDTLITQSSIGCDSIVIWKTRIYFINAQYVYIKECGNYFWQGDSLFLSGTSASGSTVLGFAAGDTLTESGTYKQNLTNISGCDSILSLYLTIDPSAHEEISNTACESYTLNGVTYTESGDYEQNSDTTMAITRNLFWRTYYSCGYWNSLGLFKSYKPADWSNLYTQYNSDGGTTYYFYNGNGDTIYLDSLHQVVQYIDTVYACKETTLHLTINQTVTTSFEVTACDSYTWNDSIYTVSGDYTQTFTTANGCDSVVTLHLTLNYAETAEFSETACDSYSWNETTYTSSGDYTQTFTNVDGCDSTVTLHLTVNTSDHTDLTATACGEYVWLDSTYTASGNYSITYTNVMGCDSIVTLHLTINPIPEVTITGNTTICPGGSTILTATGADSYQWGNGSTNASIPVNAFGQYSVIGTNATGCFSNASVTVLVSQPPVITISGNTDICAGESTTLTVNGGVSYMWSDGSTDSVRTVSVGGTWQVIGYNEIGCSGMTSVTVNVWQPAATNLYITAFDSCYVWFGTPYCESGDYTYTLQTIHGCDSVITLHLTLEDAITNEFNATGCDSYTWNSITYTQSGDYTQTLAGASGYDSIVTMHLTLYSSVTSEFSFTTPDSCYIWNGISYCTSGDYSQTLQTVHGCDSVVTLHLTITVGIDDHNFGADMTVYPNPTSSVVNVECTMNNVEVGRVEFQLFDAFGRLLRISDGVGANHYSPLRTAQINLSHFAAGVYFVKAVTDGNIITVRKVVKR